MISEYFREGDDPITSIGMMVDGGFGMGANLPLYAYGETEEAGATGQTVTTSSGKTRVLPKKADFGTLSSGGLY